MQKTSKHKVLYQRYDYCSIGRLRYRDCECWRWSIEKTNNVYDKVNVWCVYVTIEDGKRNFAAEKMLFIGAKMDIEHNDTSARRDMQFVTVSSGSTGRSAENGIQCCSCKETP